MRTLDTPPTNHVLITCRVTLENLNQSVIKTMHIQPPVATPSPPIQNKNTIRFFVFQNSKVTSPAKLAIDTRNLSWGLRDWPQLGVVSVGSAGIAVRLVDSMGTFDGPAAVIVVVVTVW